MPVNWTEVNDRRISEITQEIRLYSARKKSSMTDRAFDLARQSFSNLLDNIAERNPKSSLIINSLRKGMESQDDCIAVISEKQASVLARGVVYNYMGDDLNLYPISAKDKLNRSKVKGFNECDIPSDELTDADIVFIMFACTMGERFSGKTNTAVNDWFKQFGFNRYQAMVYSVYQYTDGARSINSLPQISVFGHDYRIAAKELLDKGFLRQLEPGTYEKTSKVINPQKDEILI